MDRNISTKSDWVWRQALTNYTELKLTNKDNFAFLLNISITCRTPVWVVPQGECHLVMTRTWQETWQPSITNYVNTTRRQQTPSRVLPSSPGGSSWCGNKVAGLDLSVCRTFILLLSTFLYLHPSLEHQQLSVVWRNSRIETFSKCPQYYRKIEAVFSKFSFQFPGDMEFD